MANVASAPDSLETAPNFPAEAKDACQRWLRFVELGAVSPDLPYLVLVGRTRVAEDWANLMHFKRTDGVIRSGVEQVRQLGGIDKEKALTWLLGYTSHVVMDVTIHPVINLLVGDYETHKKEHRRCEMKQDVFIFHDRIGLDVTVADHLNNGVARALEGGQFDPVIRNLWETALASTHSAKAATSPPQFERWAEWFLRCVAMAEKIGRFVPLARHVTNEKGVSYPLLADAHGEGITGLPTPNGTPISFTALFDRAHTNVLRIWSTVARGALGIDDEFETALGDWNLDTGKRVGDEGFVFWE